VGGWVGGWVGWWMGGLVGGGRVHVSHRVLAFFVAGAHDRRMALLPCVDPSPMFFLFLFVFITPIQPFSAQVV
jgi:hypothetical protein